jgi:hypothetical protein
MTGVHLIDSIVDTTNTFGAVKYTMGSVTYVVGAESVNDKGVRHNAAMFGATVLKGKNAYKVGTHYVQNKETAHTVEYSRTLGKGTTANFNFQHVDSLKVNGDTDVFAAGIRHDF